MSVSLVFMYFAILYMKIYEMKRHILFILTLLLFFYAKSQPNCIFTHYSSENGLSQNSIMSMVQDHNEFYGSLGMESTGSMVMTSKFIKPDKGIKLL